MVPPERRTVDAIDRHLAKRAVKAGYLTYWQAQQILLGRADHLRIHKYTLLDVIGEGGMGRVYLALDTRLNRRVALKVLLSNRWNHERAVRRFQREARLGAQLQHENLVRIYDEGEANGCPYLVMEYVEGKSVGQLLTEYGPMPAPTAARLVFQVALGLEHARQKGMIHRDINPRNILVTREGIAKLADLGLAIAIGDDKALTLDGAFVGTYDYVSPEQARHSRNVDIRGDIYSLGCTFYHMVAGQVPFPYPSLAEKIQAQLTADPPPLSTLVPGVPEGLDEVVSRMMRKSPAERYPDPLAVTTALEPFLEGGAVTGRIEAAVAAWAKPDARDPTRSATQVKPVVVATVDGGASPSPLFSAYGGNPPAPSSDFVPTTASPSTSRPDGVAPFTAPEEIAPDSMTPTRTSGNHFWPSVEGLASRLRKSEGGWSSLVKSRVLNGWVEVALLSILAGALLVSATRMMKLGSGGQVRGPSPELEVDPRTRSTREKIASPLAVVIVEPDGTETRVRDLKDALRHDARGNLRILLRGLGPGPVRLEAAEALAVLSGTVTIAADPGARPVLAVDLSGPGPFFRVGPRAALRLDGLAIRAEHAGRVAKAPPLFEVSGTLELRRCAFWTTDQAVATRAISSEGPRLWAMGCWFQGFNPCLDVGAFAGTEVVLEQCMVIRSPGSDPSNHWAIHVRHEPSHSANKPRKLALRRCTVWDACLLRADDFTPAAPLTVAIEGTAVQAGTLLAWNSASELARSSLDWSGRNNLYDLSRTSWVIPLGGPTALDGLIDSEVWTKMMEERGSQDRPIPFPNPVSTTLGPLRPEDFPPQKQGGATAGADPRQVGPETKPLPSTVPGPDRGALIQRAPGLSTLEPSRHATAQADPTGPDAECHWWLAPTD